MDLSLVAPELRGPARWLPPLTIGRRWALRLVRLAAAHRPARRVAGVRIEHLAAGRVPLRIYRPTGEHSPVAVLWIHGGGYVLGSPVQDDTFCSITARDLGVTIVSVDYRLAPEHPFPAPLQDCWIAWMWLQRNASRFGIDPARVVLGGQSAGGGLAACLCQRLVADGGSRPAALWLSAPMLDDRTAARRDLDALRHLGWTNDNNLYGWSSYLATPPGATDVPEFAVAARRDDLTGTPPTWIGVGTIDLFHDEDVAYAQRLRAAGVEVELDIVPGAPHGFDSWAPGAGLAREFHARARRWLATTMGLTVHEVSRS